MQIRPIQPSDNPHLAKIIRATLAEFGANHPGTVYFDPTTDALFELFQKPKSAYFVLETDSGEIAGGGGIFPTDGLPSDTCELVKMYLLPAFRGAGLGRQILEICLQTAREKGYSRIYLETMPELKLALKAYEKLGFTYLPQSMGNSGHFGCALFMYRELAPAQEDDPMFSQLIE
jgi:putative acetyltransferase